MNLPISACIITFNEEHTINSCLESLSFADEIIVVDSFSSDRTVEIAKAAGAKIFLHPFEGHIQQKNYALSLAKNEWIIALDADERVTPELKKQIENLFQRGNLLDGYTMPRKTFYIDKWISHGGWYPDRHLRLFRKSQGHWGGINPHDRIILDGRTGEIRADLAHYSFSSLSAHIKTINRFSSIMARNLSRDGKTNFIILRLMVKPAWKFIEMFFLKRGFLDGKHGLIIAGFSAFATMAKLAKLFEITRVGDDGKYRDKESL